MEGPKRYSHAVVVHFESDIEDDIDAFQDFIKRIPKRMGPRVRNQLRVTRMQEISSFVMDLIARARAIGEDK